MRSISTFEAPGAVGPYSQAVVAGRLCFCSGQIAIDPKTDQLIDGDAAAQTRRVLQNIAAVLTAAGTTTDRVAKVTVYLANMDDYAEMNAVYDEFFSEYKPARAAVEVSRLPKGALVEIDAIAMV